MSCSNPPESDPTAGDGDGPAKMMERKPKLDSSICIRCKEEKGVLVIRHASYCKTCLPAFIGQKFTRSLLPHLPALRSSSSRRAASTSTPTKPTVLLACSGGSSSMTLLDMFHKSYCSTGPRGRERWGQIVVAWVDFGREGGREMGSYLKEVVEGRYGWEFKRIGVEEAFGTDGGLIVAGAARDEIDPRSLGISVEGGRVLRTSLLSPASSATSAYQALLSTLPTPSHPAITSSLLSSLLTRLAHSLSASRTNPTILLTGLNATRAASLIISQTASGGGYALPLLVAPVTEHVEGVKVVRPMTALSGKEVGWYARNAGLRTWNLGSASVGGAKGSIEKLTGDFVQALDRTHPSTVSTIARTASKLIFSGNEDDSSRNSTAWKGRVCPLCELPADPSPLSWLATTSLTSLPATNTPESANVATSASPPDHSSPPLEEHLCYACLTTLVSPAGAAGGGAPRRPAEGEAGARLPGWTMGNLVRERRKVVGEELKGEGWLLDGAEDEEED